MNPQPDFYPSLAAVRERYGVTSREYHDAFMAEAEAEERTHEQPVRAQPHVTFVARGAPVDQRVCLICGTAFRPSRTQLRRGYGYYCSTACAGRGRHARRAVPPETVPHVEPLLTEKPCAWCGTVFAATRVYQYYCCASCLDADNQRAPHLHRCWGDTHTASACG